MSPFDWGAAGAPGDIPGSGYSGGLSPDQAIDQRLNEYIRGSAFRAILKDQYADIFSTSVVGASIQVEQTSTTGTAVVPRIETVFDSGGFTNSTVSGQIAVPGGMGGVYRITASWRMRLSGAAGIASVQNSSYRYSIGTQQHADAGAISNTGTWTAIVKLDGGDAIQLVGYSTGSWTMESDSSFLSLVKMEV